MKNKYDPTVKNLYHSYVPTHTRTQTRTHTYTLSLEYKYLFLALKDASEKCCQEQECEKGDEDRENNTNLRRQ